MNIKNYVFIVVLGLVYGINLSASLGKQEVNYLDYIGNPLGGQYTQSLMDKIEADSPFEKCNKEHQEGKVKAEQGAKLTAAPTVAGAMAVLKPKLAIKKNIRTKMQQVLYSMFKKQNKYDVDLPDEIWESIFDIGGHKKVLSSKLVLPDLNIKSNGSMVPSVGTNAEGLSVVARLDDKWVYIDGVLTGNCLHKLQGGSNQRAGDEIQWSPNGRYLAIVSTHIVRIWDIYLNQCISVLQGHRDQINSVAWSPNGEQLATAGAKDQTACIWDIHSGKLKQLLQHYEYSVCAVSWAPDGKYLTTGALYWNIDKFCRRGRIWDVATGKLKHQLQEDDVDLFSVSYGPTVKFIATSKTDYTLRIYDAATGVLVHSLEDPCGVDILCCSLDGKYFATWSRLDQTTRIWNTNTGECLHIFKEQAQRFIAITSSPDGKSTIIKSVVGQLNSLCDVQFFVNDLVSPEQYLLFAVLEECKKAQEKQKNKTISLKALGNTQVSSHEMVEILSTFHPIITQAIIDHYQIIDAHEMLDGLKKMKQVKQDVFEQGVLPKGSPMESVMAEYLIGPKIADKNLSKK